MGERRTTLEAFEEFQAAWAELVAQVKREWPSTLLVVLALELVFLTVAAFWGWR